MEASWESGFFGAFFSFSFSFDLKKVRIWGPGRWKRFAKRNHFQMALNVWSAIGTGRCIFRESKNESYPSCGSILMGWKNQLHTQCVTVYCWIATLSGWESSAGDPQQGTSQDISRYLKNRDAEHHGILELELPTMELVDAHQYYPILIISLHTSFV